MNMVLENLSTLYSRYPELESRFSVFDQESCFERFRIEQTEAAFEFYENDRLIDSSAGDFHDVELASGRAVRLAVILGFGLGSLFQKVSRVGASSIEQYVIIEPSPERFLFALSLTDFRSLLSNPSVHFLIGQSPEQCFASFFNIFSRVPQAFRIDADQFFSHSKIGPSSIEYFEKVKDEWNASKKQIKRSYGSRSDSLKGLKAVVGNTDFINSNPGVRNLREAFESWPAIVVSAGPSLVKSLPAIKELENKALIIANDATIKILMDAGIQPHIVASIERGYASKKYFEDVPAEKVETHLVVYPLVPNEVIEAHKGPKWVAYRDHSYFGLLNDHAPRGFIGSQTSVAHMCVRIAEYLGCPEVVLVGQDLSYDPSTLQSHSAGVAYDEWTQKQDLTAVNEDLKKKKLGQVFHVAGNLVESVPTNSVWFSMIREFGLEALSYRTRVYNCTLGGARIPNIEWRNIQDVTADWSPRDQNAFEILRNRRDQGFEGHLDWTEFRDYVTQFRDRLLKLRDESKGFQTPGLLQEDQKETIVGALRSSLDLLAKDRISVSLILELNASEHVTLEQEWHSLPLSKESMNRRLEILTEWFGCMYDAAQEILDLMGQPVSMHSASKKK